jgi:type I restriction enzyme R subunit
MIVIDEAHRSVYRKYGALFDWFDGHLVGLTATPRGEVDRDTYRLFNLQTGVPTDVYGLEEAVGDKFLVPPRAVSVPLGFQRGGIRYDDLSDEEKESWDAVEWDEDGTVPDRVEPDAVNKWLFNADTVDKVLEHLMTNGLTVADGDRLGKTIIFAKNHDHAVFIAQRFDANYPHLRGLFARVIDFKTDYADTLIEDFSVADKAPHIAISVDMLDTGIDVPEVVNLVFFKIVRSKTKFWQMIGRGTRLCPDLFGARRDKECFRVFDFCQNFEFFNQNPEQADGPIGESLSRRLFVARVDLLGCLDKLLGTGGETAESAERGLRGDTAERLHAEVAAMPLDNFVVRARRRLVEKYADAERWRELSLDDRNELTDHVAGLPTGLTDDDLEAKQFDLLVLRTQLALLQSDKSFATHRRKIVQIVGLLEERSNVPMIAAELELILAVQTDDYWQDITAPMLEAMRRRLRALVKLIELKGRVPVYTDFEDTIGVGEEIDVIPVTVGTDMELFRRKALHFLKAHENHIAVLKLRRNEPLTAMDLAELERMFLEEGVAAGPDLDRVRADGGVGLFVRSLVGLDREAAKRAFDAFLTGRVSTANQIVFLNMVIDHLTERGVMEPSLLYESPFTDFDPNGADGVFGEDGAVEVIRILQEVRQRAAA